MKVGFRESDPRESSSFSIRSTHSRGAADLIGAMSVRGDANMNRNSGRSCIRRDRGANLIVSLITAGTLAGTAATADAGPYRQIDLNTDSNANLIALGYPATNNPDNPDLKNPWGISHSATSPFWLSDNGTGLATLYNGAGTKQALVVTIAPPLSPPPGFTDSSPTGQVHNPVTT